MNITLFPMTLSIPSDDIGNKVGLRTYQHSLIGQYICGPVDINE